MENFESKRLSEATITDHFLSLLMKRTKNEYFSKDSIIDDEERSLKIKALIETVKKMGISSCYQMPESFRAVHDIDEWKQHALMILENLSLKYDHAKGTLFDRFILYLMPRRLTSIKRKIFRKNPPVDEDVRKIIQSEKKERGHLPTAKQIADLTGRDEIEIQKIMDGGFSKRLSTNIDNKIEPEWGKNQSPDYMKNIEIKKIASEKVMIMLKCLDRLDIFFKNIFRLHFLDEITIVDISKMTGFNKSTKQLERDCKKARNQVSTCMNECYTKRFGQIKEASNEY